MSSCFKDDFDTADRQENLGDADGAREACSLALGISLICFSFCAGLAACEVSSGDFGRGAAALFDGNYSVP